MVDSIGTICLQYGVSRYGFLPGEPPLKRLPDAYYDPWEDLATNLPDRLRCGTAISDIRRVPLLATSRLQTEPQWRRAYCVLTFLAHAHVWGDMRPNEVGILDKPCFPPF